MALLQNMLAQTLQPTADGQATILSDSVHVQQHIYIQNWHVSVAANIHPRIKSIPVWGFLSSTGRETGQMLVAEGV